MKNYVNLIRNYVLSFFRKRKVSIVNRSLLQKYINLDQLIGKYDTDKIKVTIHKDRSKSGFLCMEIFSDNFKAEITFISAYKCFNLFIEYPCEDLLPNCNWYEDSMNYHDLCDEIIKEIESKKKVA